MRQEIKSEIIRLCDKAFEKARKKADQDTKHRKKFEKRTGLTAKHPRERSSSFPHPHFDPAHCKRNANGIASAIWKKVLDSKYEPTPAILFQIPKADGTKRDITAFGIPDAALANILLRKTLQRNKKRLSPHSYAYHPDKNVFDAILALTDFDKAGKLFAVQIDFQKYFDTIPSGYLKRKIQDRSTVSLTPHEKEIFATFLHHKYASLADYKKGSFKRKSRGTPQGSSASLFLANLANHDLDKKLASEAGKFVRFADDVVAICGSYEDAQRLERCFEEHCVDSGLVINRKKSPGISIISDHQQEIRTTQDFTYLGYRFTDGGLTMPEKTKRRLQSKVSRLINVYLLSSLEDGYNHSRASRSKRFDWDLLGLIYELRRGFYGGLRESEISSFISGGTRLRNVRGLMGFYCLIEDPTALKELDGWCVGMVRRACKIRRQTLIAKYGADCPTPSNEELILGTWMSPSAWRKEDNDSEGVEVQFPSLVRGWRASRKHFFTFGLENVQAPGYNSSIDVASLFDEIGY